jgi:cbb3-type cytochrome oxidase cytochrome c subunit
MNQGPVIFLGVFFALVLSWFGLILQPQLQLGAAKPSADLYNPDLVHPAPRAGLAQRGLEVYRSLGCATCHTQQIQQQTTVFDIVLANPGTNVAHVIKAILELRPDLTAPEAARLVDRVPVEILDNVADLKHARSAVAKLSVGDAKVDTRLVPVGPDISRGWGVARSVGTDFLYDNPVMLGSQRIGPDLANVGAWPRTPEWHLQHLYDPTSLVPKSVMPPYRFLFEKRPKPFRAAGVTGAVGTYTGPAVIAGSRTNWVIPDKLEFDGEIDLEPGYEIVPTEDARALVAYMMSLRADSPILERPLAGSPPLPDNSTEAASNQTSTTTDATAP